MLPATGDRNNVVESQLPFARAVGASVIKQIHNIIPLVLREVAIALESLPQMNLQYLSVSVFPVVPPAPIPAVLNELRRTLTLRIPSARAGISLISVRCLVLCVLLAKPFSITLIILAHVLRAISNHYCRYRQSVFG